MKTKEEIYKEYSDNPIAWMEKNGITSTKGVILRLMQEDADEQSIAFAEWIVDNYTPNGRKGCWDSNELNSERESKYLIDSTTKLLQIFKNENK